MYNYHFSLQKKLTQHCNLYLIKEKIKIMDTFKKTQLQSK